MLGEARVREVGDEVRLKRLPHAVLHARLLGADLLARVVAVGAAVVADEVVVVRHAVVLNLRESLELLSVGNAGHDDWLFKEVCVLYFGLVVGA